MIRPGEYLQQYKRKLRLVSVDLFDTLVTRTFARPTDLFYELEKQLIPEEEKFICFARERIESEFQLREEKDFRQEVTLDEIYARLQTKLLLSPEQIQEAQKRELQLEEQSIMPIRQTVAMIKAVKDAIRVILVSDTYLPEVFIARVLEKKTSGK